MFQATCFKLQFSTLAQKPGFVMTNHFILRPNYAKEDLFLIHFYSYRNFCSDMIKVCSLKHYTVFCDHKDVVMIRDLCDAENIDPQMKLCSSTHYSLQESVKIPLHLVIQYQSDTNVPFYNQLLIHHNKLGYCAFFT